MKLLLVEDNAAMQTTLARSFERRGMQVTVCGDGARALDRWRAGLPDVVLLDLTLPGEDGLSVLAAARAEGLTTPVLILTARGTVGDRILGLNTGADDYLAKPFDLREVALRCEALARRGTLHQRQEMRVGPLTLLVREKRALYEGRPLVLTQTGFSILQLLCREHPQPVSRSVLVQHLWGANPPDSDALKSHIYTLRKTLEGASGRNMLATILQLGYRLDLEA